MYIKILIEICAVKEKIAMLLESGVGAPDANEYEGLGVVTIFIYTAYRFSSDPKK